MIVTNDPHIVQAQSVPAKSQQETDVAYDEANKIADKSLRSRRHQMLLRKPVLVASVLPLLNLHVHTDSRSSVSAICYGEIEKTQPHTSTHIHTPNTAAHTHTHIYIDIYIRRVDSWRAGLNNPFFGSEAYGL